MKRFTIALTVVVFVLLTILAGTSSALVIDLSGSTPVITGPSEMILYNFDVFGFSCWAEFRWHAFLNMFVIRDFGILRHTDEAIENGAWTVGVTDPGNAFDTRVWTRATIPWYWGEGDRYDFLHFTSYIGNDRVFMFHIVVDEAVGSAAIEGYNSELEVPEWERVSTIVLDRGKSVTIIVEDAQDYVENGYINLRVKWIDGWSMQDFYVHGIWR